MKDNNLSDSCLLDDSCYIFDTHAHYFHKCFDNMPNEINREELLKAIYKSNIKKSMINGKLVIEYIKEKSIKDVVVENICYD